MAARALLSVLLLGIAAGRAPGQRDERSRLPRGATHQGCPPFLLVLSKPLQPGHRPAGAVNGPLKIKPNPTSADDVTTNPYSWNARANLLFVDQPVGTGFSYSSWPLDYVTSEKGVAAAMLAWLGAFFALHPELSSRPFYVTGESYAGHYVPAIGYAIVAANAAGNGPHINLRGLAIGNGLVEPLTQYGAYADFTYGVNLVSDQVRDRVNGAYNASCAPAIVACQASAAERRAAAAAAGRLGAAAGAVVAGLGELGSPLTCIVAADTCNAAVVSPLLSAAAATAGHSINVYDVRDACTHPPLCYDMSDLEAYMALPGVAAALNVPPGRKWAECSTSVHALLADDWMLNLEVHLPDVLAAGVRVLVYAGDQDFICNYVGNARWVDAMQWDGAAEFASAAPAQWLVAGEPAGESRVAAGLTFLRVFGAGHMVPMDRPTQALVMLDHFLAGTPFGTAAPAAAQDLAPASTRAPPSSRLGKVIAWAHAMLTHA